MLYCFVLLGKFRYCYMVYLNPWISRIRYDLTSVKMSRLNVLLISICLTLYVTEISTEFSSEDCWSLGFNKANLLCSSCDQLKDFGLETLRDHCRECCQHDESSNTETKYASAVLEVCTCKFSSYPQIQAFVKSNRPAKFSNLQIKYVRGLDPIIKLQDKDGNVRETVAIEKWNTDTVEEFLNTHLIKEDEEEDFLKTNKI